VELAEGAHAPARPVASSRRLAGSSCVKVGNTARMRLYHLPGSRILHLAKGYPSNIGLGHLKGSSFGQDRAFGIGGRQGTAKAFSYRIMVEGFSNRDRNDPGTFLLCMRWCWVPPSTMRRPIYSSRVSPLLC
jgi:hypothetical protein